jgi:hypothetical protein
LACALFLDLRWRLVRATMLNHLGEVAHVDHVAIDRTLDAVLGLTGRRPSVGTARSLRRRRDLGAADPWPANVGAAPVVAGAGWLRGRLQRCAISTSWRPVRSGTSSSTAGWSTRQAKALQVLDRRPGVSRDLSLSSGSRRRLSAAHAHRNPGDAERFFLPSRATPLGAGALPCAPITAANERSLP